MLSHITCAHAYTRMCLQAADAAGGLLSVETYNIAEVAPSAGQLAALLRSCHVFSPNELEAETLVGPGTPQQLLDRLAAAAREASASQPTPSPPPSPSASTVSPSSPSSSSSPPLSASLSASLAQDSGGGGGGVRIILLRRGEAGAMVRDVASGETWQVPAVADTRVVDVTGCGNAFNGGFLAAYRWGEGLAASAAWGAVAAAFMAEARGVPSAPVAQLQAPAAARHAALMPRLVRLQAAAAGAAAPAAAAGRTLAAAAAPGPQLRPRPALWSGQRAGGKLVSALRSRRGPCALAAGRRQRLQLR